MLIKRTKVVEEEVDAIRCKLAVRYEDEDMPNDYPHRKGDMWNITIDIHTGQIADWPKGVEPRELYMKVCDEGIYQLMSSGEVVAERDGYVPDCIPGEYGDYIDFKIDANGRITNWKATSDQVRASFSEEDED